MGHLTLDYLSDMNTESDFRESVESMKVSGSGCVFDEISKIDLHITKN